MAKAIAAAAAKKKEEAKKKRRIFLSCARNHFKAAWDGREDYVTIAISVHKFISTHLPIYTLKKTQNVLGEEKYKTGGEHNPLSVP